MSVHKWLRSVRQWLAGHRDSIALGLLLLLIPLLIGALGCRMDPLHGSCEFTWSGFAASMNAYRHHRSTQPPVVRLEWDPDNRNAFILGGFAAGAPPYPPTAKLTWHPPHNATNIQFPAGNRPEPGGPPYVWNQPVNPETGAVDPVRFQFDADQTHVHQFSLEAGGQSAHQTIPTYGPPPSPPSEGAVPQRRAELATRPDYWRWAVQQDVVLGAVEMSTTTCQAWADFVQGERVFYALRFPVAHVAIEPPPQDPQASWYHILPVAMDSSTTPELWLEGYAPWVVGRYGPLPLEIKPEYLEFCREALPTAPGEGWVTLGPVADADVQCPDEFAGDDWGVALKMDLDFGGQQDAMVNETLAWYVCYQESGLGAAPARALARATGAQLYAAWDTVCMGPLPLPLLDRERPDPTFVLEGPRAFGHVMPSQPISLTFVCENLSTQPVDLKIEIASERGLTWEARMGDYHAPFAPPRPLPEVLRLSGKGGGGQYWQFIWFTADIPADAAWGSETLTITASDALNPARSTWNTGLVWVGDWPADAPRRHIYLPIALRH
jgi:hypothetical protein